MGLLHVSAAVEDLGYLTAQQKNTGNLKFFVYVSVIDNNGQAIAGLAKHNFGLVMFDGIETLTLSQEWEIQHFTGQHLTADAGFYGLTIDRDLRHEAVLPEARIFGLTVKSGVDFGQTIFKVTYRKQ